MIPLTLVAIAACLALVPLTWVLYLAIMSLYRAKSEGKLSTAAKAMGYPFLALGYLSDFLLNLTVGTVLFLELPREVLLSPRVARHKLEGKGYRKVVAAYICDNLLDPFDPSGCHCKKSLYD